MGASAFGLWRVERERSNVSSLSAASSVRSFLFFANDVWGSRRHAAMG